MFFKQVKTNNLLTHNIDKSTEAAETTTTT